MRTNRVGTAAVLAALLVSVFAGCAGLTRRGESDRHREAERIDTFVRPPAADSGRALSAGVEPSREEEPPPVVSGVPEEPETPTPTKAKAEATPPVEAAAPAPAEAKPLPAVAEAESLPEPPPAPPESPAKEPRYVSGYRVQLFATREPDRAREYAEEASDRFSEKVYVEYLEPYYKVRVGDCLTREEANELLRRANAAGYDEAWVATTLVLQRTEKRK